jgi:uncharacterized protein (TIGR02265 family)
MPMSVAEQYETTWNDARITADQAKEFARKVTPNSEHQEIVARDLLVFPPTMKVRGVFFEGLSRVVAGAEGLLSTRALLANAGVTGKVTAFAAYPHRDFYKLYYLAAPLLHPRQPLPVALHDTARMFFPIFKSSLLGRTMSALMGTRPATILPLLAKAYNHSVEGNVHRAELVGERALRWHCDVEPVEWYVDIFTGIIEGAMPPDVRVKVAVEERGTSGALASYRFSIAW